MKAVIVYLCIRVLPGLSDFEMQFRFGGKAVGQRYTTLCACRAVTVPLLILIQVC